MLILQDREGQIYWVRRPVVDLRCTVFVLKISQAMSASPSMWTKTSFKLAEGNIEMEITKCSSMTGRWTQYNEHVIS